MRNGAGCFIVLATVLALPPMGDAAGGGGGQELTYEDFERLTPGERREHFDALSPAGKATLLRRHVNVWLEQNRARLTSKQVTIVEELGQLMVERFDNPGALQAPAFKRRADAMFETLTCGLLDSDVREVLGPMGLQEPRRSLWDDLRTWLEECVAPRVLQQPDMPVP